MRYLWKDEVWVYIERRSRMKREKVLMMIVMCIFFAVGWNSVAMAEDDLNNGLPEVIT